MVEHDVGDRRTNRIKHSDAKQITIIDFKSRIFFQSKKCQLSPIDFNDIKDDQLTSDSLHLSLFFKDSFHVHIAI